MAATFCNCDSFRWILLLSIFSCCFIPLRTVVHGGSGGEEFTEELLLKPLPDRKALAHFRFRSTAPPSEDLGRHHHILPKAIAQLVLKFKVRELELSFTQGRWNYESWGGSDPFSNTNAKPPGVELWALFDLPSHEIDSTWRNLTHALSGLFCSSINFLESSTTYSAPQWGLRPNSSYLRYGALPREAVCTENLTPWLKLLPCRDKAGLSVLLDRPSIYGGVYHSQRLHLFYSEQSGLILDEALTVVLKPPLARNYLHNILGSSVQPSWSISSLFKNMVTGICMLAKSSKVFLDISKNIVDGLVEQGYGGNWNSNPFFELSVAPDNVIRELDFVQDVSGSLLFEFNVDRQDELKSLDVGIFWKLPFEWSSPQAPFHASRFLMGSGNERGTIAISLQSTSLPETSRRNLGSELLVVVLQIVPWYVKVYYHTLQIVVDGIPREVSDVVEKIRVSPSEDKVLPGLMEVLLRLPSDSRSAYLTLDFDKGFLHIDEYPPDANQGFDIPSAVVSFPDLYTNISYLKDDSLEGSPLLLDLQETKRLQCYTELLLVPLTTPDFSMPYNVMTFVCTVLALYFGSLLNVLRRRFGEEERLLKASGQQQGLIPKFLSKLRGKESGQSSPLKPSLALGHQQLPKIIAVALLAALWHFYQKSS